MKSMIQLVVACAICSLIFVFSWIKYGDIVGANESKKEAVATKIHAEMMSKFDTTRDYKREVDSLLYCSDNLAYISDACVKRFLSKDAAPYSESYNKRLYEIQSESIKLVRKYGYQPEDFKDVVIKAKGFGVKSLE